MFWLKVQLRALRREAAPSAAFKRDLLRRVTGAPAPWPAFRFAAVGIAVVALCFGTGTGVYAYESPGVVEGHPLYFMKHGLEQVEGRLATTPEARASYHAKMMERRMSEAERFADMQERVDSALEAAAAEMDFSVEELKEELHDPSSRQEVIERLREQNDRYERVLRRVPVREGGRRPLPPPEAVRERLNALTPDS